ncbi:MAG TPA: AAA family ATPase [Candidatus Limnocylindrales bacterium]|nr:AAA family ATPase [Candidatus Limnocylindrales bacterium]
MAAGKLRARLLGGFELGVGDGVVAASAFERPSGLRLLKLLLVTPGHRLRREEAAELLWPDADPERSGANLRKAIHFARRGLASAHPGAEAIVDADGREVWLDRDRLEVIDADELAGAIGRVEARQRAGDDRLGSALAILARSGGETLLPADPYEPWLEPAREGLRQRALEALVVGAEAARASADRASALALAGRALALEPAEERAHRLLIELHLDAGELHAARRQLQSCRQAVAEAYGVEPDPALATLIAEATASRPKAERGPIEAPIVGRRAELERARAAIDGVAAGARAGAILIRGQAGIGKSRVLREVVAEVRAAGWSVLELRGLEDAVSAPFAPVAQAIVAGLDGDLGLVPEPARSAIRFADPTASAAAPAVAFGSDAPVQRGLLDALAEVGPREVPIALAVDDAQWLDRASLELLEAAIGGSAARSGLVVVTVRDEPSLVSGPVSVVLAAVERTGGTDVRLGPLAEAEIRDVIERDVAGGPIADDLAAAIGQLSAGAPLFAADLFRSARETALVEERDGRWSFRRGVTSLQVPESIVRLVDRRISRMGPVQRLILATAAELGDVVAFDDLVETGSGPDEVLDAVDAALAAGLVVEREGRYAFAHPLYRAALRRGLPPRDRASVHRRIAIMLSAGIDPHDPDAVARAAARGVDVAAVAGHAASAVELGTRAAAPLAVGFGIGAGIRQAYLFDFPAAVTTLQRALRLWARQPEADRAAISISPAYVELGQALRRTGDDTGAAAAFQAAMDAARDDDELATAASAAAWLPYEHGRFRSALAILDAVGSRLANPLARAQVDSARGWIIGRDGHWTEAAAILQSAVRTLDGRGPSVDLMRALDRLAIAYRDSGASHPAASIPILERAIHMAVELGRTGERAAYEMHLGGAFRDIGRTDDAVAALDRARGLARLTGELYIESVVEWMSAEAEETRGDPRAAIAHRRRELEIFTGIGGNPRHEALAHAHIAHLARRLGDDQLARTEAELARVGARHSGIDGLEARIEWALSTEDWFASPEDVA